MSINRSTKKERKEIRLLHLLAVVPGLQHDYNQDCILGRLEYKNLRNEESQQPEDDTKPYMALSYVWGEPKYTSAIILDDGTYISITGNLLIALQHVFGNGFAPVSDLQTPHKAYLGLTSSRACIQSGLTPCA
jgi:hypothetical protein